MLSHCSLNTLIVSLVSVCACFARLELVGTRLMPMRDFDANGPDHARLFLYVRNTGGSASISDYAIDGTRHGGMPDAAAPVGNIPTTRWWMCWPNPVGSGDITTVQIHLVNRAQTLGSSGTSHTVTLYHGGGSTDFTVTPAATDLWMPFVAFSDNLKHVTVYAGNRGSSAITLASGGGIKINSASASGTMPSSTVEPGDVVPIAVSLSSALEGGSHVLFELAAQGGARCLGSMRAIPSTYGVSFWQFGDYDQRDLQAHFIDTDIPGSANFQDEPIGSGVPPQQLADRVVQALDGGRTSPIMIQLTGQEENRIYCGMADIAMTHHENPDQDLSLFLTWPRPIWYLPQNAWGRMENLNWQKENWYRLEDLHRQAFQGLGHGAKNTQWFTYQNLWQQGYGFGGGGEVARTHQDMSMPGAVGNPVLWDRVGRVSAVCQILEPYLKNSAPGKRYVDNNGLEVSTIVSANGANAVIVLVDNATERAFYLESQSTRSQTVFTDVTVEARVPGYLSASRAYLVDPFEGISELTMSGPSNGKA
ncbi:MAG: hypothetical protein GF418_14650, partial [Chitinivibrionales bacterium]|nr:hypothetical protein [Chitinivibrionales bacterium]MBD3396859.1 hypothetical protein [Chitinivibrionales bacterium]